MKDGSEVLNQRDLAQDKNKLEIEGKMIELEERIEVLTQEKTDISNYEKYNG